MRRAMLHPLSISGISFEHFTGIGNTAAFSALLVSEMNPYEIPLCGGGISHLDPSVICGISHEIPGHRWDTSWDLGGISQPKSFRSRDRVENDFFRCEELSQSARYPAPEPGRGRPEPWNLRCTLSPVTCTLSPWAALPRSPESSLLLVHRREWDKTRPCCSTTGAVFSRAQFNCFRTHAIS